MKGYLLQEQAIVIGEDTFVDSRASENSYAVVFEDDTETGYFYALEITGEKEEQRILDALHIYNVDEIDEGERKAMLRILWSKDWQRCALIINNYCHAVFDFKQQGGYNRNEFPPPNDFWTKGERQLTDEMVTAFFS